MTFRKTVNKPRGLFGKTGVRERGLIKRRPVEWGLHLPVIITLKNN